MVSSKLKIPQLHDHKKNLPDHVCAYVRACILFMCLHVIWVLRSCGDSLEIRLEEVEESCGHLAKIVLLPMIWF